jgi:ParB-like chromosome segregation protein Spo0J
MQSTATEEVSVVEPVTPETSIDYPTVKISDIIILDRKREMLSEARLAVLEDSINDIGLLQPIVINKDFILIAGRHRIEVFKRKGIEDIPAVTKEYNSLDAELAEIDENLVRFELTSLERSIQYARRKEIYEEKYPRLKKDLVEATNDEAEEGDEENPGFRETSVSDQKRDSFVIDTAKKTGSSTTKIRDEANFGKELLDKLTPEVRGLIAPTKVANNKTQLQRLIDEPDADIRLEAAQMVNESYQAGGNLSIPEALRQISGATTYESTVAETGETTLNSALKKNLRTLELSVNTPKFKETAETWTYEGVEAIREEFFRIEQLAKQGSDQLTEIMEAKEKLGKT